MKILLAILAVSVFGIAACGDDDDGGNGPTGNDRVLKGNDFIEVFKDDGNGKNYLYTITEFKDRWGRNCTVVTGDSEQTIAVDCQEDPLG